MAAMSAALEIARCQSAEVAREVQGEVPAKSMQLKTTLMRALKSLHVGFFHQEYWFDAHAFHAGARWCEAQSAKDCRSAIRKVTHLHSVGCDARFPDDLTVANIEGDLSVLSLRDL